MEIPAELKVHLVWPCRFIQACGGVDSVVDPIAVRNIGAEIAEYSKALLPLAIGGHWTLLVVDLVEKRLRFVDTLDKVKSSILEKLEIVLKIFKDVAGLEWIPTEVCRTNACRQGAQQPDQEMW